MTGSVLAPIEFWFDFSSPYSYIASELIDPLAARYGRRVKWRPIMLGAAFKASGQRPLVDVPLKGEYCRRDFARSARFAGIEFHFPSVFPAVTLAAARGYYWLHGQDCAKARAFAHDVFRAYWVHDRDIGQLPVVLEIVRALGIDTDAFALAVATSEVKDHLRQETEAAIAAGLFGAPYFMVDGEPFWGADRLLQLEKWLATGGF